MVFRTFLSPLLRLYDRALSEELRLETLQFLLSCVVTASVAEGQTNQENNGKVRSSFTSDGALKEISRLADQGVSEGPAAGEEVTKRLTGNQREGSLSEENKNTLRGQLLAHMDAVQVSEFIGYVLQTRPSVTAVGLLYVSPAQTWQGGTFLKRRHSLSVYEHSNCIVAG